MRRPILTSVLLILCAAGAKADVCGAGTLDITAQSDTPFILPTFNVGQLVRLTATATGITLTSLTWNIDGPLIKDYNERVGESSTGALAWSTTPVSAADLAASPITFYWKPSASQIDPLNGGPVTRNVSLTGHVGATTCVVTRTFSVERNTTDPRKQANDYYTSNHPSPTETTPGKGIVIDDHLDWHEVPSSHLFPDPQDFFRFHRSFIARFNSWRAEFGYPPLKPWYPGTPYPAGIDDVAFSLRSATYSPDANELYRPFTIAGGNADPSLSFSTKRRLADYADANDLDNDFEGTYHGQVHCNVGTNTVAPGGITFDDPVFGPQPFGDMCNFSSPKDPIFYPWHYFVDLVYANLCAVKGLSCPGTPAPATDVWMADNAPDLAANGTPPSPAPHYLSPDIWNRTTPVACTPANAGSGVVRNCGSSADHQNPVAGVTNFLYATIRNDRPGATNAVYSEVAVYVANASTGLAWPINFGGPPAGIPLDETRHFITLYVAPGTTTAIGPLPWTPPNPSPSDHWCLYIRVLNVQEALFGETSDIDANTAGSNSISWRNLKIVTMAGMMRRWPFPGFMGLGAFIVRDVHPEPARVDLTIMVPRGAAKEGSVRLQVGRELARQILQSEAKLEGFATRDNQKITIPEKVRYVPLRILGERAVIRGIQVEPGKDYPAAIDEAKQELGAGAIIVEQKSNGKTDGGVVLQLEKARRIPPKSE